MAQLLAALVVLLCSYSYSNAQVSTNCVPSTDGTINPLTGTQCLDPVDNTIKNILDQGDFGTGRHNQASGAVGTGGRSVNQQYNNYTGTTHTSTDYILHFSYTDDTWVTNMAINQALTGAGFDVGGYVAEWEWKNENTNTIGTNCLAAKVNGDCLDDLVITIDAYASGINIYSERWDYSQTKSNGWTAEEVLSFAPVALVPGLTIDEIEVSIRGKDNGYWQGMYGPKVQNLTGSLILMPDFCTLNGPLSDPSCPGYAAALFAQQCQTNPLFDPSCPGYSNANQTLICNQNPASDPSCPDYYVANCQADPLWDPGCTGYAEAYFDKQCEMDAQYDQQCVGYVDLSNSNEVVEIFDPVIEDVLETEYKEEDFFTFEFEEELFKFEYTEEVVEVEPDMGTFDGDFLKLEDDIEKEIAQLEKEEQQNSDGELNLEDDIETEIAKLEESTTESDFDDPTMTEGEQNMEDDIEKEIAKLEEQDSVDEAEEEVQVSGSNDRPDRVERVSNKDDKREVVPNKSTSRRDKMRMLIAQKAIETTRELETAITLEQQMDIQRRLLALISYVPEFKDEYTTKKINQVNFYPPTPVVDHAYSRWFLNDPTFGAMEDLQYSR